MERTRRREFPYVYSPGKKLFKIVVKLSDAPGSLGSVLELLSKGVNLLGSVSYTLGDGKAMWSGFGEALGETASADAVSERLKKSKAVMDCEVLESVDGLLVDSFHQGIDTESGEAMMLIPRHGISHMFDQVVRQFGSGGEVLLYRQGTMLGTDAAKWFVKLLGPQMATKMVATLRPILSASGWGVPTRVNESPKGTYTLRIDDCFECSHGDGATKSCSFLRGYLEGSATAVIGTPMTCSESKCRRRGERACEFVIGPKL